MKTLTLQPTKKFISKYHALLEIDWTDETTDSALKYTRRLLAAMGCGLVFYWEKPTQRNSLICVGPETTENLRDFMLSFHVDTTSESIPELPIRRANEPVRLSRQTLELSVLLNIQYLAKTRSVVIADETHLLRNSQSLLATLGIQYLLPQLRSRQLRQEEQFATAAIRLHIAQIWRDDLSHQAFLAGLLAEHFGNHRDSRRNLEFAFETTSSQEHDYLTNAHVLWYHYLDSGATEKAKRFVLSLYRSSPAEYLDEIEEMMTDTFATCEA